MQFVNNFYQHNNQQWGISLVLQRCGNFVFTFVRMMRYIMFTPSGAYERTLHQIELTCMFLLISLL